MNVVVEFPLHDIDHIARNIDEIASSIKNAVKENKESGDTVGTIRIFYVAKLSRNGITGDTPLDFEEEFNMGKTVTVRLTP